MLGMSLSDTTGALMGGAAWLPRTDRRLVRGPTPLDRT